MAEWPGAFAFTKRQYPGKLADDFDLKCSVDREEHDPFDEASQRLGCFLAESGIVQRDGELADPPVSGVSAHGTSEVISQWRVSGSS
ncbi:MAG TPA: hypothetical protein VK854_15200 [Woeseiaceae bacterium]|nr:hypothetical protein [Woeseiaceae bacterium]